MTSTHQHHSRYALHPPPQNSQNEVRLPSLRDLDFKYQPLPNSQQSKPPQTQQEHQPATTSRHPAAWGRTGQQSVPSTAPAPHQQHTPPLSAGHEIPAKVEYPSKHDNGGYAHPGIPLSAQATPLPGSVSIGSHRGQENPHSPNQPKRRTSNNMSASRDVRESHPAYPPPQYASYTPAPQPQAYHQIPSGLAGPPTHAAQPAPPPPAPPQEQIHHHPMPVSAHPGYTSYQHAYMQPRQPVMHQQQQQQQQHPPHQSQHQSNPYPSPGPPPAAPPPQGPWAQTHPQAQQHAPPQPPPHHHQQAPPPQPPPPQHAQHTHIQPHLTQHQPPMSSNPPHPVQQQHHQPQHQQPPPPTQHAPPPQQHQQQQHAPPPQYQQQYQQPPAPQQQQQPPPPQQQQQIPYARTTAIVPTNLDTRPPYPIVEPERVPSVRNDTMSEITNHCNALYNFASRYAQLPHTQPSPAELEEMSQRALTVVRLLEELRRMNMPEGADQQQHQQHQQQHHPAQPQVQPAPPPVQMQQSPDDPRPPKRPWEDISQDEGSIQIVETNGYQPEYSTATSGDSKPQSTAEQDMELIRTKRATSTAQGGANGSASGSGQPKSKYRKRSRATPPGKCHSCNIRETPEWRRGPDGARTLCNACGLHYAKLMRKRDKANQNGEAPHIDLETLRASARAADIHEKSSRSSKQQSSSSRSNGNQQLQNQSSDPDSPMENAASTSTSNIKPLSQAQQQPPPPQPQQTHQSSFQLVTMMAPPPATASAAAASSSATESSSMQVDRPPSQQQHHSHQQQPTRQQTQHQQPPAQSAQQPHTIHGHPPPITALNPPPPPWPTTASTRDVYSSSGHIHQSFLRGSQQASR